MQFSSQAIYVIFFFATCVFLSVYYDTYFQKNSVKFSLEVMIKKLQNYVIKFKIPKIYIFSSLTFWSNQKLPIILTSYVTVHKIVTTPPILFM